MSWLRRTFLTGIIVTVPLIVSLVTLGWIFRVVDAVATPVSTRVLGRAVPGVGVLVTAVVVLAVGAVATNVFGRRVLARAESWLLQVPVFKTIYAPVKQLVAAFSPDNDAGFKKVVILDDPHRGMVMGFLTREFVLDRGQGAEALVAVYVPTNHLYLGDMVVCRREQAWYPDLSVEDGIRIFLTGGMALPERIRGLAGARGASARTGTRTGEHADET
jgi:uncharacterized membrane protein